MPHPPPNRPGDWKDLPRELVARFDAELAAEVAKFPPEHREAAMLPALRIGQEIFGSCSPAVQRLAAARLGTSAARAEEVATFYVMFHTEPTGRHLVEICTNVSCCLAGGEAIFAALKRKLGVDGGGTTRDGRFTLREVECLGACGTAPAMLLDEEPVERLTLAKAEKLLEGLE
ncbi:MAG TPA: NAD(P)H-dependent oxidoreductase subunit E [Anaeromyxobacteraceae bacterium]|jgi:NADH-quinone oxidoreductase subunit E